MRKVNLIRSFYWVHAHNYTSSSSFAQVGSNSSSKMHIHRTKILKCHFPRGSLAPVNLRGVCVLPGFSTCHAHVSLAVQSERSTPTCVDDGREARSVLSARSLLYRYRIVVLKTDIIITINTTYKLIWIFSQKYFQWFTKSRLPLRPLYGNVIYMVAYLR